MLQQSIKLLLAFLVAFALSGCDEKTTKFKEVNTMPTIHFTCALEKDHNPPLDPDADKYFQQARILEKTPGIRNWPAIISNYQKAVEKDHWKAMNNLAGLYRTGKRSVLGHPGIDKSPTKTVALYARMVELGVPVGYYNWAITIGRGEIPNTPSKEAGLFMTKAADLGYPLAQIALGNYYSFGLPRAEQRDDIAEQYFNCAGKQDNPEALLEVASFYQVAKENKPLALYFYQKAASLGSTRGMMRLKESFSEDDSSNFGYNPDKQLEELYDKLYYQLRENPSLTFPDLMKEHPLPRHPTQGYNADNPDVRPDY